MCGKIRSDEVMHFLHTLFSQFDALVDKYECRGVYKVETIGGAYFLCLLFSQACFQSFPPIGTLLAVSDAVCVSGIKRLQSARSGIAVHCRP